MAIIESGFQVGTPEDYIMLIVNLILGIFALGMLCRCILLALSAMTDGRDFLEAIRILKKRLFVIALVASTMSIINLVEGAFR